LTSQSNICFSGPLPIIFSAHAILSDVYKKNDPVFNLMDHRQLKKRTGQGTSKPDLDEHD
jgi:hypothetical protein